MRSSARKILVAAAVCAGSIAGAGANGALAGEMKGNGEAKEVKGRSICAYSGQNDDYHTGDDPERTQSYGQEVRNDRIEPREGFTPGQACRPSSEH